VHRASEPEIEKLQAVARQKYVRGLQIAVNDPTAVQSLERREDGEGRLPRLAKRNRSALQTLVERFAVEQLHCEKERFTVFANLVDLTDGRVIDARSGPGLPPETRSRIAVVAAGSQHLDGHGPVETIVVGEIDHTHAAFTQALDDAVASEGGRFGHARSQSR